MVIETEIVVGEFLSEVFLSKCNTAGSISDINISNVVLRVLNCGLSENIWG